MADPFGFLPALEMALHAFDAGARGTGRTTRILAVVKPGDQVVVPSNAISRHYEANLRHAGIQNVRVIVHNPATEHVLARVGTVPQGQTYFDHTWWQLWLQHQLHHLENEAIKIIRATSKVLPDPDHPHARTWADLKPTRTKKS